MSENDRNDETLDDLDTEVVEDLDVDESADDIAGGTANAWTAVCNAN